MSLRDKVGRKLLFGGLIAICIGCVAPIGISKFNPHKNIPIVYNYRITQDRLVSVPEKNYSERAKVENQLKNLENNPEITNYNSWNSTYAGNTCKGLIFGGLGASFVGMMFGASHLVRKEDLKRRYGDIVNFIRKKD